MESNPQNSENGDPGPQETEGNGKEPLQSSPDRFVTLTLLFEGSLAILGLLGGHWSGIHWPAQAEPRLRPVLLGIGGGVGLFFLHLLLFFPGGESNPFYRYIYKPFKEGLLTKLPEFSLEDIIFIAVMSGIGEEILFRGWIQTQLGIIVASVLFGLIHIWGKEGIGYGLYAVGMGFILGYLYQFTGTPGNLWAPVLAHAVNNFLGLYALQADYLPG
jgi:membrane protease YdiL (CAAX protease family)